MNKLKNKQLIIFDLDDTLYLESEYVLSGFRVIAKFFSSKYALDDSLVYSFLSAEFFSKGRDKIFNKLFSQYSLPFEDKDINELVTLYREHLPSIVLPEYNRNLLVSLRTSGIKVAVVTDGLPLMQKNKTRALDLHHLVDKIVYCWEMQAPKPNPAGFLHVLKYLNIQEDEVLIIGDNPIHDIQVASKLGIESYRVLTGRFKNLPDCEYAPATRHFNSLEEIFGENLYANNN